MKLQLDTENKTIKIESDITLKDLVSTLEKLLPGEWKSFTLQTHTLIQSWTQPYVIEKHIKYEEYPWYKRDRIHQFYCKTGDNTLQLNTAQSLNTGVYNVKI